jgi:hypothetical protein
MNSSEVAFSEGLNPRVFLSCRFVSPLAALRVDPDPELQVWHRRTRGRSDGFALLVCQVRGQASFVCRDTPGAMLHGAFACLDLNLVQQS